MVTTMACPICGRPVPLEPERSPSAPFCSRRCRLLDLKRWSEGEYRLSRSLRYEELDEGSSEAGEPA